MEKLNIGVVGVGNHGASNLAAMKHQAVVAVCDVDAGDRRELLGFGRKGALDCMGVLLRKVSLSCHLFDLFHDKLQQICNWEVIWHWR